MAASRTPPKRNEAIVLDKEGHVASEDWELTTSEDSGETLLRGLCSNFVS